uniref:Uncharacterized protein n=1 Tax=Trypanosoma congolense (strain IL3000) TaxID=1068625 RepID=G0URK8_TRYCI|nr:hypothetical protein, unlikely [Trypanosoma congolense IL3000]
MKGKRKAMHKRWPHFDEDVGLRQCEEVTKIGKKGRGIKKKNVCNVSIRTLQSPAHFVFLFCLLAPSLEGACLGSPVIIIVQVLRNLPVVSITHLHEILMRLSKFPLAV